MKRISVFLACLMISSAIFPATIYVDRFCTKAAGNGSAQTCLNTTTNNPKKTIQDALAIAAPGDHIQIVGIHATHDTFCPGSTTGDYEPSNSGTSNDLVNIDNKTNITFEPKGYPGSPDVVFLQGAKSPSGGWSLCPDNINAPCTGVPVPSETYFATDSTSAREVPHVLLADGNICYRVGQSAWGGPGPSGLTNNHADYNPKRCSTDTWRACDDDSFCPTGQTCTATKAEQDCVAIDVNGDGKDDTILLRSVSAPGNAKVFNSSNGTFFNMRGSNQITIRGFKFRGFRRGAVYGNTLDANTASDFTVTDNEFYYNVDEYANGSDYQIGLYQVTSATISNNHFAYSGSEAIHGQAAGHCSTTTTNLCYHKDVNTEYNNIHQKCPDDEWCVADNSVITISGNWFHNEGDRGIMGPGHLGTPTGMILGENGGNDGPADYTSSVIENNFIEKVFNSIDLAGHMRRGGGIAIENNGTGWTIRNNYIKNVEGQSLSLGADGLRPVQSGDPSAIKNCQIYNNTFEDNGTIVANDTAVIIVGVNTTDDPTKLNAEFKDNKIYNNTAITHKTGNFLYSTGACDTTRCTGSIFQNNAMKDDSVGFSAIRYNFPGMDFITNNIYSTITPEQRGTNWHLARIQGADYDCDVTTGEIPTPGNLNYCKPVTFVNEAAHNLHPAYDSQTINAGTTVSGATRTTSMNNTVAGSHGLPYYSDNSAIVGTVDIGSMEYRFPNQSLESGLASGWGAYDNGCTVLSGSSTTAEFHSGLKGIKIEGKATGPTCGGISYTGLTNLLTTRPYTISFWMKSDNATIDYPLIGNSGTACTGQANGAWMYFACPFTPISSTDEVHFFTNSPATGQFQIYVDDFNIY